MVAPRQKERLSLLTPKQVNLLLFPGDFASSIKLDHSETVEQAGRIQRWPKLDQPQATFGVNFSTQPIG